MDDTMAENTGAPQEVNSFAPAERQDRQLYSVDSFLAWLLPESPSAFLFELCEAVFKGLLSCCTDAGRGSESCLRYIAESVTEDITRPTFITPTNMFQPKSHALSRLEDTNPAQPPFCHCQKSLIRGLELSEDSEGYYWEAYVHIPDSCPCCGDPHDPHAVVTTKEVRVEVPPRWHQDWMSLSKSKMAVPAKNLSVGMTHSSEGKSAKDYGEKNLALMVLCPFFQDLTQQDLILSPSYPINRRVRFWKYVIQVLGSAVVAVVHPHILAGVIASLAVWTIPEAGYCLWQWLKTGHYRAPHTLNKWAVHFEQKKRESSKPRDEPGSVGGDAGDPWDEQEELVHENGGRIPLRVIKELTDLSALPDYNGPVRRSIDNRFELVPTPYIPEYDGNPSYGIPTGKALRAGPMLGCASVYNPSDFITKMQAVKPRLDVPMKFDSLSRVAKRCERFTDAAIRHIFTPERIHKALARMPMMVDLASAKYSRESVQAAIERALDYHKMPPCKGQVKLEVVSKGNKPARIIINEGIENQMSSVCVVHIFEEILFEHCAGSSVKHKTRENYLDEMCEVFSKPYSYTTKNGKTRVSTMCGVEVDQTKFDAHETMSKFNNEGAPERVGLLTHEIKILDHIYLHMTHSANELWRNWEYIMVPEEKNCEQHVIFKGKLRKESYTMIFKRLFRKSGNRRTSSANFYVEVMSTLSSITENPEHFWTSRISDKAHIYKAVDGRPIYLRFSAEGDDLGGQTERRMMEFESMILDNYALLGLEVKLAFIVGTEDSPGRLEFCGSHMLMIDGLTKPRCWAPDAMRSLVNSGAYVTSETRQDHIIGAMVASYWMKACLFTGRFDPIAQYYAALARSWSSFLTGKQLASLTHEGYTTLMAAGVYKLPIASYEAMFKEAESGSSLSTEYQRLILSASLGLAGKDKIDNSDYGRWLAGASGVEIFTPANEVFTFMPTAVVDKIKATFTSRTSPASGSRGAN